MELFLRLRYAHRTEINHTLNPFAPSAVGTAEARKLRVASGGIMYVEHRSSLLSRPGPLVAVIGVHVMIAYLLSISMGIVKVPKILEASNVIFIPEPEKAIPEPEIPVVKPEVDQQVIDSPMPDVIPPEMEAPPAEMPPSDTAPVASTPVAPVASAELKTRTRIDPTYPPSSRRAGEEGTVQLRILVDERGAPREVQVSKGSGFARLDQAAIDAVRKWRFIAAISGGQAVTAWTQVSVTFRLQNS
jgi:periplasmic protein TonB